LQDREGWGYAAQMVDYKSLTIPTEEVQTEADSYCGGSRQNHLRLRGSPTKTMLLLAMTGVRRPAKMPAFQLARYYFERASETSDALRWADVFKPPRTKTARAIIPLPEILAATLAHFGNSGNQIQTLLFVTRNRRPLHPTRLWKYGFGRCLISWPSPLWLHAFRHTHTMLLLAPDTGATPKAVQDKLAGTQIPASLLVSMPTFLGMRTAKPSRKLASLVFKVFKAREETSTFS